ncbi:MAG: ATP-binding protein [Lachnospiraceae bacterium]
MEDKNYLGKNQRGIERIILIVYSAYTLAMSGVSMTMKWPGFVIPVIFFGLMLCWIAYLSEYKSYRFRAFLISGMTLMNFAIYAVFSKEFVGILSTFAALVILLGIFSVPEIVYLEVLFAIFLVLYHGFIRHTIPFDTGVEKIRSMLHIISVFTVEGVTYYLIKTQREMRQKLLEVIEDLTSAEQSKSDFLANISHEIRTPINTVCGMSEMILREDISDTIREDTFNIQAAGRNLLSIVSDVLDFSELESGKMELVEEPYNLTSTINDVINMAIAQKGEKKIELIVDCDAGIPYTLLGDEQKLRRVILSFVNNAIKFTEAGCISILVSARKEDYGVNLSVTVKDTGIGIAEENQEKLFHCFNQVDTKRNRQEGGIGIGLAIAKEIVSRMGGFISVKSTLGKGSEFRFVVPQKVVDDRPMVAVNEPESLNIISYINSEKYSFAEIRDDYMESIRHMAESLEVRYQACRNLQEFKRRMEKEIYTHAFITVDEYREDQDYFEQLSDQLPVIMIQDREHDVKTGGNIRSVYKPFYVLSIAAVLNGEHAVQRLDGSHYQEKKFIAPEACVLVVDDNLMNLKVVEGLLRPYKIKVFVATSGKEALAKLDTMTYDIIFMDHMMPEMDGVETAHKIRSKPGSYYQNVPIVALTANAISGAREMFLSEGFQDYVAKPIEMSHFERVLRKYIPENKIEKPEELDILEPVSKEQKTSVEKAEQETVKERETQERTSLGRIDRKKGIRYCGGNEEDYEEVVQMYYSTGLKKCREIRQMYEEKNWKNYTILVHALKSTSLGIGATELGEMAKALEAAGKEENIAYITEHHEEVMQEYEAVLKEIGGEEAPDWETKSSPEKERTEQNAQDITEKAEAADTADATETVAGKELSKEEYENFLSELAELLDTFEMENVVQKIEEAANYCHLGVPLEYRLRAVKEKVEQFDFCGAAEELETLRREGGNN